MNPQKQMSLKVGRYLIYALIVIIPAVFSTNFYTTFSAPKLALFQLIISIILIFWGGMIFTHQRFTYKKSPLNIILAVSSLVSIISTATSTSFFTSLFGTYGRFIGVFTVLNFLLFSFIVANHLNKKNVIQAVFTSVITASLLSIYGLIQYFNYFQDSFNWSSDPAERVFGTMGHPNHFGVYLGINLVLAISVFSKTKNKIIKTLLIIGIILQVVVLVLTASRAAIIATVIGILVVLILFALKHKETIRVHLARFTLAGFIILILAGTAGLIYKQEIENFPLISRTIETVQNIQQGNIPDRLSWWISGMQMISDKPLFGFGLSAFHDTYNQYRRTDFHTLEQDGMEYRITPETAHNEFINIGATQGLIGLSVFLILIAYTYLALIPKYHDMLNVGLISAITVFFVDVFFGFGVIATYFYFYLLIGLTIALTNKETKKSVTSIDLTGIKKYPLAMIIIVVALLGIFGSVRFALSEYYYKEAIRAEFAGDRNFAIESFERAIANKPEEVAFKQDFADFALQNARSEQAIKNELLSIAATQYETSISLNPHHPSTYFNLGSAYLEQYVATGDESFIYLAEQNFQVSVEKAVNNPLYPYYAGVALMALDTDKHLQMALDYFEKANQIRPDYLDIGTRIEQIKQSLSSR